MKRVLSVIGALEGAGGRRTGESVDRNRSASGNGFGWFRSAS